MRKYCPPAISAPRSLAIFYSACYTSLMITEPLTLYKLMILYLLKSVNYLLSADQMWEFFSEYEYTTYFTLRQCLGELHEAHLIREESSQKATRYSATAEGEETLRLFQSDISSGVIEDMDEFLSRNKIKLRTESSTFTDFSRREDGSFQVLLEVRDGASVLYRLELSVPDQNSAERICGKFSAKNSEIYQYLMRTLLG